MSHHEGLPPEAVTLREDSLLEGIPGAAVRVDVRAKAPTAALTRTARQRGEPGRFIPGGSLEIDFRAVVSRCPFQARET